MVSQQQLMQGLAVFIIASFVLGMFAVLGSVSGNDTAIPTPSPTVAAGNNATFEGLGSTGARVLKLYPELLVRCDGNFTAASEIARAMPELETVLPGAGSVYARVNATINETEIPAITARLELALADVCTSPAAFRRADVRLEDNLNITSEENTSRFYTPRTFSTLAAQAGSRTPSAWVAPDALADEVYPVDAYVRIVPGETPFYTLQAQRPDLTELSFVEGDVLANVTQVTDRWLAKGTLAWESRGLNATQAQAAIENALGANATVSLDGSDYVLVNTTEIDANATQTLLANLSFVRNTNRRPDALAVFVDANHTDRAALQAALLAAVPGLTSAHLTFTPASLVVDVSATNATTRDQVDAAVAQSLTGAQLSSVRRYVFVTPADPAQARAALQTLSLPQGGFEALAQAEVAQGAQITVHANAIKQGRSVVQITHAEQTNATAS